MEKMKDNWQKIKEGIERFIPMTLGSLILFGFIIYLIIIVTGSVIENYKADKDIDKESYKLVALELEIRELQNKINYYQTASFKEKEAREKLGYKAPGENVISLPLDTIEEKIVEIESSDLLHTPSTPNYRLWWKYFFN
jgi:cell division protein FtsB